MTHTSLTFSALRRKSIEAYGNAVVVDLVFQIFKTIEKVEEINYYKQLKNNEL